LSWNLPGWKDKYNWVSSAYRWWFSECKDMSELSGVV